MGEKVTFKSNGQTCEGYLAKPPFGKGPAVVVIQEWWGLVPHIMDICDRFAKEGFVAVAPDLYHGKTTKAPDEAGRLLMELDVERANAEIAGAADYVLSRPECSSKTFGVVGFCMGGALAQYAATIQRKGRCGRQLLRRLQEGAPEMGEPAGADSPDLRRAGRQRPRPRRRRRSRRS